MHVDAMPQANTSLRLKASAQQSVASKKCGVLPIYPRSSDSRTSNPFPLHSMET